MVYRTPLSLIIIQMSLSVSNLCKSYPTRSGSLEVLKDCSIELESGQSLSIVGPSGSGKSTLLSILGTLEPATFGSIRLNGIDYSTLSDRELPNFRRHQIGFVFQEHHLLPQCSALENVLLPFLAEGRISAEQRNRGTELLERVGLTDRLEHRPAELSGGERQRVAIARALVYRPTLILADEPTGNLDRNNAMLVSRMLLELVDSAMLILVTHDPRIAEKTKQKMLFT
ncbi:lipoprotein-releasing system ATP-binding protein LolD 1 [Planctomycetales bacterium]|nr:lipoprotein-releasing system ATP-binding protein LolD 1 [Planctomycetales bacterium]